MGASWRVALVSNDPAMTLSGWLGPEAPTPAGGGGGFELVTIPRREPVSVWRGPAGLTMTLTIVFDRFGDGVSVGPKINDLMRLYGALDTDSPPPVIRVRADGNVLPFQDRRWTITDVGWGPGQANHNGNRTQQMFPLTLAEFIPDQRLAAQHSAPAKRRRSRQKRKNGKQGRPAVYVARRGETLIGIAARYEITGGWRTLAAANGLDDPADVAAGDRVRLP